MHLKKSNSKNSRSNWQNKNKIWNKIADKITRVSKTSPKNSLETNEEEILKENTYL